MNHIHGPSKARPKPQGENPVKTDAAKNPVNWMWVNRTSVKPNSYNPNEMDDRQYQQTKAALKKYGWVLPIVTRPDGTIIDGEHRWRAAGELGMTKVPVIVFRGSEADCRDLTLRLNYGRGTPQFDKLADNVKWFVEQAKRTEEDLLAELPFSETEIEDLLAEIAVEAGDADVDANAQQTEKIQKAAATERLYNIDIGPFTRDERDEVYEALDHNALAKFPETERLLRLVRAGYKSLLRTLEKQEK